MTTEYRATSLVAAILIFALNAPAIVAANAVGESVAPIRDTGAPHTNVSKSGGGCPDWVCSTNGRALTGITLPNIEPIHVGSTQVLRDAKRATVRAPGRGGCEEWGCGATNGTQLTGLTLGTTSAGRALTGIALTDIGRIQLRSDQVATDRRQTANWARGRGCPDWQCTTNGRTLTGIALSDIERLHLDSTRVVLSAKHAMVRGSARGGCEDWGCGTTNGTQLTGLTLPAFPATPRKLRTSSGPRRGCDDFGCGTSNGAQLTGVALRGQELQDIKSGEADVRLARRALQ